TVLDFGAPCVELTICRTLRFLVLEQLLPGPYEALPSLRALCRVQEKARSFTAGSQRKEGDQAMLLSRLLRQPRIEGLGYFGRIDLSKPSKRVHHGARRVLSVHGCPGQPRHGDGRLAD